MSDPRDELLPDQWRRVTEVFSAALERAPADRAAFLDQACGTGDPAVRREVEALLAAHQESDSFLETPAPAMAAPPSPIHHELVEGQTLGPYRVLRTLGHGGMATVYLARDERHRRSVALKVLHPDLAHALGPERFLREIEVAANLSHPHILPLHDSGEAAGLLYYVMPYVEGESLRDRLTRETQLPVDEALQLAREVADALAYAHGQGIIHRDIKPENILLSGGHALVADFGIARVLGQAGSARLTATGMAVGTAAYMSPEQASATSHLDGRSDVYSLGCVLYEMLAGEPPFTGPTPQAILAKRLLESVPRLGSRRESLPEAAEWAVTKALARLPADRFQTAAEFAHALAQPSAGRSGEAARVDHLRAPVRRRFLAAAALSILATATWLGGRYLAGRRAAESPRPASLAILPFKNLGPDSRDEYLSDGITEDLINALGRVPGLRVVARTSAFTFKGVPEDVRNVGTRLNVGAVVEGSLRRMGDTLRVTAQLVNVASGYQLWSNRYDRPAGDLLRIEDDLSRAILRVMSPQTAANLKAPLAGNPTDNSEAYKLYLKGRYHIGKHTEEDYRAALRYFDEAIGSDPTFALAYSGLADAYALLYSTFLPPDEGMPKAKAAARRALELDPSLAEAHASLGNIQSWYEQDWAGAEQSLRRAIELNPNYATARHYYGILQVFFGRFSEATAQFDQARQLDPLSLNIEVTAVWPLLYGRRYDEAINAIQKTVASDSNFVGAQFLLAQAYRWKGEYGLTQAQLQRVRRLIGDHPDVLGPLGYLSAVSGQRQKAYAMVDSLKARYHKGGADEAYALALVYTALGEKVRALDWLETSYAERCTWLNFAKVSPDLDPLRAEPRFRSLLRKLRLDGRGE